jgi:hypothetical protein
MTEPTIPVRPACLYAAVDFRSAEPLLTVADRMSKAIFGGVPFTGLNTGIWDEVPAVRLSSRPLGLEVVLGAVGEAFTLEIETHEFPWESVPKAEQASAHADFSWYLAHVLRGLGFDVTPRTA